MVTEQGVAVHDDLISELKNKYPGVFSCIQRAECGNGWYWILDALGEGLSGQASSQPIPSITLLKEKFGLLRFGKVLPSPEHKGLFVMATLMSARTCEICGSVGRMQDNGRRVRCPFHAQVIDTQSGNRR